MLLHNLRAVVDGKDDIGDTGGSQCLDLVQDHWPVTELDQRLGQGQGLGSPSVNRAQANSAGGMRWTGGLVAYERP